MSTVGYNYLCKKERGVVLNGNRINNQTNARSEDREKSSKPCIFRELIMYFDRRIRIELDLLDISG